MRQFSEVYLDEYCVVWSLFWGVIRFTFYKPEQGRNPIVTWFRDCK